MNWTLDKSRPISLQLCEKICVAIASGEYKAGDRLLSVRDFALLAGVNPNTVQKSFEELERRGVIHSVRCSGWYVNDDICSAKAELSSLRRQKTEEYIDVMIGLGCGTDDITDQIKTVLEERKIQQ